MPQGHYIDLPYKYLCLHDHLVSKKNPDDLSVWSRQIARSASILGSLLTKLLMWFWLTLYVSQKSASLQLAHFEPRCRPFCLHVMLVFTTRFVKMMINICPALQNYKIANFLHGALWLLIKSMIRLFDHKYRPSRPTSSPCFLLAAWL